MLKNATQTLNKIISSNLLSLSNTIILTVRKTQFCYFSFDVPTVQFRSLYITNFNNNII